MAKTKRLKEGLYTVAALTFSFGPLVTANAGSGIFFGAITPGGPAIPGVPGVSGSIEVPQDFGIPTLSSNSSVVTFEFDGYDGYSGYPGTQTIPAIPEIPAISNFNATIDDGEIISSDFPGFPGYPGYSANPGTQTIPAIPEIPEIQEIPAESTDALLSFPGIPAIPAIPAIPEIPATPCTSLSNLSSGQRFAIDAINNFISQSSNTNNLTGCPAIVFEGLPAQQLSPQAAIQAETIAITSPYQFIRSINDGMQLLMAGRASAGMGGISGQAQQPSFLLRTFASARGTPSFSAYGFVGPFGVSLSGGGSFGSRDNANGQTGFKVDTQQANLIIDYSFNQKLIGGFSFGYLGADRNLKLGSGSLNSDSYRFAPFFLYRPTANSYLNVMGGYALANYDSTRSVTSFNGIMFGDAKARYDSDQFFASVGGGYTLAKGGWSLRGYARGDYSHIDIEGFRERGGLATDRNGNSLSLAMQVNKQNIQSVTSTLGAELSHTISTKTFIPVIIPRVRAEWVHEFENDSRTIKAGFIDQNGVNLTFGSMSVAGPVRNWANLGFGVQMLFARSIVGYINYDRLIISHANNNTISGGIRMNF